jgi:microcystin-dependent protein
MAKKFAEITGIYKIFKTETPTEGQNTGKTVYTEMYITDSELKENIDENTIVFVTADIDDEGKIIGPNNYKISKDDCFIVAQNKVYATFGKVNVSDVMGPTGEDGLTPYIDSTTGNWFIGTTNTGVKAQGSQGIQGIPGPTGDTGPAGSQYIQLDLTDYNFTANAQQIIEEEHIRIGDYSISNDTNTIWKCISDTEFSPGPSIKGDSGQAETSDSMPIGSITMFAGDIAPDGWVFCKGQVIPTIDEEGTQVLPLEKYEKYQSLISVIKDTYYAYDGILNQGGNDIESGEWINIDDIIEGQTVANLVYLPDFSLRFPYGASDTLENSYLDVKIYGGESSVEVPLPKHTHEYKEYYVNADSNSNTYPGSWSTAGSRVAYNPQTKTSPTGTEGVNGKNPTIDIIPKYTMINFIIKY